MLEFIISKYVRPGTPFLELTEAEKWKEIKLTIKNFKKETGMDPHILLVSSETLHDLRKIREEIL